MSNPNITPNSVISLMAPTACGKTALAYELYDTGRYELISVDSALIYRDMNIGTAKPTSQELQDYPHHIVNIIDPTQSYSVADFVEDVDVLVTDIHSRDKIPLLVGGTMMYYMALFDGLSNVPDSDASIRIEVEAWRKDEGINALHEYLQTVDKPIADRLNATDTQRITRAVEVYKQTGKPISYWQAKPKKALAHNPNQNWIALGVMPDRAWLHKRIEKRLDIMWQEGFVPEVIDLIAKYELTPTMPSMRCVGYRQVIEYLLEINKLTLNNNGLHLASDQVKGFDPFVANDFSKNQSNGQIILDHACQDMKNKALYATRQLAKRQSTWLRKITQLSDKTNSISSQNQFSTLVFDAIQDAKQWLM